MKATNEEMSNAFMRLHDFAVSQGLLDRMPEFGEQLRSTTEKFLTLARRSSDDDDAKDDEQLDTNSEGQGQSRKSQPREGSSSPEPAERDPEISPKTSQPD